jgi:hypothetical protein
MATYQERYVMRTESGLLARFVVAIEIAAAQIISEDPQTENHTDRMAWAKRALLQDAKSQSYATIVLRLAVAENGALQESGVNATDSDVQFIVNSYIGKLVATGA